MAHLQDAPIMPVQIRAVKMRFFKRLLNINGETDIGDLVLLINRFGACPYPNCPEDLDDDDQVDMADIFLSLPCWGAPF